MLHGYYHDEMDHRPEFTGGEDLIQRVSDGRKYLEDLLGTAIRVFVPPRNAIGPKGLRAVVLAGLHLGGTAGLRKGWSPFSTRSWAVWRCLRSWRKAGRVGTPWILDLGDHREIPGNAVTPSSTLQQNEAIFQSALSVTGVFCAAAHYWELGSPSIHADQPTVGEQLQCLIYQARSNPQVVWQSVGQIVSESKRVV